MTIFLNQHKIIRSNNDVFHKKKSIIDDYMFNKNKKNKIHIVLGTQFAHVESKSTTTQVL